MAKVASPTTTKRASSTKTAGSPLKSRSRAAKEVVDKEVAAKEAPDKEVGDSSAAPIAEPRVDGLQLLTAHLNGLEEKIAASFSALASEVQNLKNSSLSAPSESSPESETLLPILGDLIRRNLTEQLSPIVTSLKRIEERVGFIGNRLKGAGQDQRPKPPWRHDQQRHNNRPRGHNGQPRPAQGQQWTPPSAASVQGHFAPRPLRGGESDQFTEDEE